MNKVRSSQPFGGSQNNSGVTQFAVTISSGSATLQMLAGNNADTDTWVNVPDGAYTASTTASFYSVPGTRYRWVLTGDAVCYMSS